MADHKFVYTVSGIDLSEGQKATISQAIAAAVSDVLLGDSPEELTTDYLTLHRIYGGKWIPTNEAARLEGEDTVAVGSPA
jgi:hypothetical protein